MQGAVYVTEGYGFLCLPRSITDRLDMLQRHYYRIREQAISILSIR